MGVLKALYWRTRIVLLAIRWILRNNLGDRVAYQGEEWILIQGVRSPVWTLTRDGERVEVHEKDFRKVRRLSNYLRSFRWGYRFYMTSWYHIWMREGIQPWMRGCNIW